MNFKKIKRLFRRKKKPRKTGCVFKYKKDGGWNLRTTPGLPVVKRKSRK